MEAQILINIIEDKQKNNIVEFLVPANTTIREFCANYHINHNISEDFKVRLVRHNNINKNKEANDITNQENILEEDLTFEKHGIQNGTLFHIKLYEIDKEQQKMYDQASGNKNDMSPSKFPDDSNIQYPKFDIGGQTTKKPSYLTRSLAKDGPQIEVKITSKKGKKNPVILSINLSAKISEIKDLYKQSAGLPRDLPIELFQTDSSIKLTNQHTLKEALGLHHSDAPTETIHLEIEEERQNFCCNNQSCNVFQRELSI